MRASAAGSERMLRPAQKATHEEVPTMAAKRSLKWTLHTEQLLELWQQQRGEPEQPAVSVGRPPYRVTF